MALLHMLLLGPKDGWQVLKLGITAQITLQCSWKGLQSQDALGQLTKPSMVCTELLIPLDNIILIIIGLGSKKMRYWVIRKACRDKIQDGLGGFVCFSF